METEGIDAIEGQVIRMGIPTRGLIKMPKTTLTANQSIC